MGNKKQATVSVAKDLKQQITHLDQLLSEMRRQVVEARRQGPSYRQELLRRQQQTEDQLAGHRKTISSAKAHCKKRKREIDEWKLWYNSSEKADKSADLDQLNREIEWRAADIAAKETEISAQYTHLLVAEGESEQLALQLEALSTLSDTDPVDADPRIQHILEARAALSKQLKTQT